MPRFTGAVWQSADCPPEIAKIGEKFMELLRKIDPRYYVLDPVTHETRPVQSEEELIRAMGSIKMVRRTQVGPVEVFTCFLVINHGTKERPRLFETMVFGPGGDLKDAQWRYSTWDEAVKGHEEIVKRVRHSPCIAAFLKLPRKRRLKLIRTRRKNQWYAELAQMRELEMRMAKQRGEEALSE